MVRVFLVLAGLLVAGCGGTGPIGPQGPAGERGSAASATSIVGGFHCSKVQGGLFFGYTGSLFSTGDLFVTCEVSGGSYQSSSANFYDAAQSGAQSASCLLTYDGNGGATAGYWTFSTSGVRQVTYHDAGDGQDGLVVTFSSCSSY